MCKEREMCCLLNHLETSYFKHVANNINDLCNEEINHQILEHLNIQDLRSKHEPKDKHLKELSMHEI